MALHSVDLTHGFLWPARDILYRGQNLVGAHAFSSYPPFFFCVMAMLAQFQDGVASVLWSVLMLLQFGAIAVLVDRMLTVTRGPMPGFARWGGPVLASLLLANNLHLGQTNVFPLFFIVSAAYLLLRGDDLKAGALLSIAIAYKVTPALFLGYLLLKRRWRALGAAMAGMVVCFGLIPMLYLGPARTVELTEGWGRTVLGPFLAAGNIQTTNLSWYHTNQSLEAFLQRHGTSYGQVHYGGLHRLLDPARWTEAQMHQFATLGRLGVLGLLAWVCLRRREVRSPVFVLEIALGLFGMLYVSPCSWVSHYVTVVVALMYVWYRRPEMPNQRGPAVVLALAFVGVAVGLTPTLLSYSVVFLGSLPLFGFLVRDGLRAPMRDT